MRKLKPVLLIVGMAWLLQGCTIILAGTGDKEPDLKVIQPGGGPFCCIKGRTVVAFPL